MSLVHPFVVIGWHFVQIYFMNFQELCSKESEFKAILFSLCYFHACVCNRKKFGPQGWNISYPFSIGDLTISVYVLFNYLESNRNIPWADLRYLFGEIMYGGHITDDWDRRLCQTYLNEFMQAGLLTGDLSFCNDFEAPPVLDLAAYHQYVNGKSIFHNSNNIRQMSFMS